MSSRARAGAGAASFGGRGGFDEGGQFSHAAAGAVRRDAEFLGGQSLAVDPEGGVAEPAGARGVPAIRRHEDQLARRRVERGGAERVRGGRGLVGAHGVHGQHVVEQAGHARALDRDVEHLRIAVREDRETRAAAVGARFAQAAQHRQDVGEGRQAGVFVHQTLFARAREREVQAARGVAQRVERDVPERLVARAGGVRERAQLRVLDLLETPELRERFALAREHLLGGGDDGMHVEERAVRVEDHRLGKKSCRCGRHSLALRRQRSR
ncbi:hypothetical protein PT2222_50295 [Paraburkholderia tropica]